MFKEEAEISEVNEDPETEYFIDTIHAEKISLAYGLYSKLKSYHNHYHIIQNKYKGLALTWMFAVFIGMGYLSTMPKMILPISGFIISMFLCLLAAQGIFLLWLLDGGIYQHIVESIFAENIILEKTFPVLGKTYQNILKLEKKEDTSARLHGMFYLYFIFFLYLVAILALGAYFIIERYHLLFLFPIFFITALPFFVLYHKKPLLSKK